jgi:two-component system LytT family sensor kinase
MPSAVTETLVGKPVRAAKPLAGVGRVRFWLSDYGRTWLLVLPLWLAIAAQIYFVRRLTRHPVTVVTLLGEMLTLLVAMVALTPLPLWAARRCPIDSRRWKHNLLQHAAILAVFGCLAYLLERSIYLLFRPSFSAYPSPVEVRLTFASQSFEGLLATIAISSPFYLLIVVAYHAMDYHYAIQEKALRAAQVEVQYSQSRLQALKTQLQPHFLFNALNAIYSHIPPEAETARNTIVLLSSFLRRSLQESSLQTVPLRQELEFASLYLEIQKLRFSNRLSVQVDVEPDALDVEVPHLVLQPLIENAIKHGIARLPAGGTLVLRASMEDDSLRLDVEHPRPAQATEPLPESNGIGLPNAAERLRLLFGEHASVELDLSEVGRARAHANIPSRVAGRA